MATDHDFTKNRESERPFGPVPDGGAGYWLALLLVAAGLVYAGYRIAEWRSHEAAPAAHQPRPPMAASPTPQSTPAPTAAHANAPSAQGTRNVTKCVVNGKTMYGDDMCPQGAASATVVTKANHNLMAGLTSEQMAAANRIAPEAPSPSALAQSGYASPTNVVECKALDEHIRTLDAMARQPQSGQMQDWIRAQKTKDRDRQLAIRCPQQ